MGEKASRIKITVLRRFKPEEAFDEPPVKGAAIEACDAYQDGQVFYVEEESDGMSKEFCGWAWGDIY